MTATAPLSPRAQAVLREAIVWDNHSCMPMRPDPAFLEQFERFRASGCTAVAINAGYGQMGWDEHVSLLTFMGDWLSERPADYLLVQSAEDIERAKQTGRLGVFFDVEGMVPVQDDPSRVKRLYELGVRWMLVAYNKNNAAGGGCMDNDGGLSAVGRAIIDEMDDAGMVVCMSHSGARTARDVLEYSRNPAIFSHSNPLGVTSHARNISDDLMKACAAKGGVIGLNGIGPFLGVADDRTCDLVPALLRHVRYVVDLVGAAHVGLGLDYVFDRNDLLDPLTNSGGISTSLAMVEPEHIPQIVDGLCDLGLSDDAVRGIVGGNWLRVAKQVWK